MAPYRTPGSLAHSCSYPCLEHSVPTDRPPAGQYPAGRRGSWLSIWWPILALVGGLLISAGALGALLHGCTGATWSGSLAAGLIISFSALVAMVD